EPRERVVSRVAAGHTKVRDPLLVVQVVAVVQSKRSAEPAREAELRARIDPVPMRMSFVTPPTAGEHARVPFLSAVAFHSCPDLALGRLSERWTTTSLAVRVHLREVVDVAAEVTPHPVGELHVPVDVQADCRGQSFSGPLLHRVEVEERASERLVRIIEV